MTATPFESIRLETHWNTLQEGSYQLPVHEENGQRVVFFYHTGIPSEPMHHIRYGAKIMTDQGEQTLFERDTPTLEEALTEFEQVYSRLQQHGLQGLSPHSR